MDAKPYGILVICTGNIHRSPTAQHLLAHAFRGEPISVVSAGTAPALGEPMGGTLAEFLRGEGIDPSGFRARFLTAADVRDADLILGMTRAHRGQAVSLWPGALRRSFTLKEPVDPVVGLRPRRRRTRTSRPVDPVVGLRPRPRTRPCGVWRCSRTSRPGAAPPQRLRMTTSRIPTARVTS